MTRDPPSLAAVADLTQRLAVLLAAGVAPVSAWRYLDPVGVAEAVVTSGADSSRIPEVIVAASTGRPALEAGGWRGLAAAWSVAADAGAPLAPTLRGYSRSLRWLAQSERDARVALAAPIATARLVMALPLVGVLFGMLLGFDTARTLFATPVGWVCLGTGGGLMALAALWNRRLILAAQPTRPTPGMDCDLMAIALAGGGSLTGARAVLESSVRRFGLDSDPGRIDAVLELCRRAGVPAGELLRSEAEEARRVARTEAQEQSAALSVKLMLPLGLCVLPAFMAMGVLPLLAAVLTETVGGF